MKTILTLVAVIAMIFWTIPALAQITEVAQVPGGREDSPAVPTPAPLNLIGKWISSPIHYQTQSGHVQTYTLRLVVEKVTSAEGNDGVVISGTCETSTFTTKGEIKEGKLSFSCHNNVGASFFLSFSLDGTDTMSGLVLPTWSPPQKFTLQRR